MLLGIKEYKESEVNGEHKAAEKSLYTHQNFFMLQTSCHLKLSTTATLCY